MERQEAASYEREGGEYLQHDELAAEPAGGEAAAAREVGHVGSKRAIFAVESHIARVRLEVGNCLLMAGKAAEAKPVILHASAEVKAASGEGSFWFVNSLSALAQCHELLLEKAEALEIHQRIARNLDSLCHGDKLHSTRAVFYNNHGSMLGKLGMYDDALVQLKLARDVYI